jgi:outer membrane protein
MKYLVKLFVITFFLIISTYSYAEQKIVVLDMNYILNQSKAGKGAQDFLKKTFKENQKIFVEQEKILKKEESDLLGKKNVLTKEDYKKESAELRKKVIKYQTLRRAALDKITSQRADSRKKLLANIEPLLNSYIKENNISLVIDKKNMLGGSSDLDITKIIAEKLDKELPSLNLK